LEEPLESGRPEPQHDLAEGDDAWRHGSSGGPEGPAYGVLADATLETMRRALAAMTSSRPSSIAFVSTSADPTPTATAPARIQSPALWSVPPPVGIRRSCGIGARRSLMYCGPSAVAGKTFTTSAPMSCASRISVGEKQPGAETIPRSRQTLTTS